MPDARAPEARHLFFVHAEVRIVRRDVAAAAEPDARDAADAGLRGDVNNDRSMRYMCLRHLLEHQHVAAQIRLQRRAEQLAEDGQVEGRRLRPSASDGLQRRPARGRSARPARGRRRPRRPRASRPAPPARARRARSRPCRARPEARRRRCSRGRPWRARRAPGRRSTRFRHAAGAIAAAREPDGVQARVVGHLEERRRPRRVVAGEMAVAREASADGRRARGARSP